MNEPEVKLKKKKFFDTFSKLMEIPTTKWIELYINIIILSHWVINEYHSVFVPSAMKDKA